MNKTELMSFIDPNKTYDATNVPDAIVDIVIDATTKETAVKLANGTSVNKGRWTGPDPIQTKSVTLEPDPDKVGAFRLIHTMTDDTEHDAGRIRQDVDYAAAFIGELGLVTGQKEFPSYSDNFPMWVDYSKRATFMFGDAENWDSGNYLSRIKNGMNLIGSSYNAAYDVSNLIRTTNRSSVWLSSGSTGQLVSVNNVDNPKKTFLLAGLSLLGSYALTGDIIVRFESDPNTWVPIKPFTRTNSSDDPIIWLDSPIEVVSVGINIKSNANSRLYLFQFNPVILVGVGITTKMVEFDQGRFDTELLGDGLHVRPKKVAPEVLTNRKMDLSHYSKLAVVIPRKINQPYSDFKTTTSYNNSTSGVQLNRVVIDNLGVGRNLPLIRLKAGIYKLEYNGFVPNKSKSNIFLTFGHSCYMVNGFEPFGQYNSINGSFIKFLRIFEIGSDTDLQLSWAPISNSKNETGSHNNWYSSTEDENYRIAGELEIWQLSGIPEITDEFFSNAVAPLETMGPKAKARAIAGSVNPAIRNGEFLWAPQYGGSVAFDSTLKVYMKVHSAFRLHCRFYTKSGARFKINKLDGLAVDVSKAAVLAVSANNNQWAPVSQDLPAGVYQFAFDIGSGTIYDAYFERVDQPDYSWADITTRLNLAMTSNEEQGQVLTASNANTGNDIWRAFGSVVSAVGWKTEDGTIPTEATPQWIAISLGTEVMIDNYVIQNVDTGNDGDTLAPKSWELQIKSATELNWKTVHVVRDDPKSQSAAERKFSLPYRYAATEVRLLITDYHPQTDPEVTEYRGVAVGMFRLENAESIIPRNWKR